jgi:hypothetical protein
MTSTPTPPSRPPRSTRWTRRLHLYSGLFISPFLAVFAISAILFNHPPQASPPAAEGRQIALQVPEGLQGLDLAHEIMRQAGVSGEVVYVSVEAQGSRLVFPVERPGRKVSIRADLAAKTASIEERPTTWTERLTFLHKYPGPHVANLRGNWFFTRLWGGLADGSAYLLLFASVTGIWLWLAARSERKAGLLCLGLGCASFAAILLALLP